MDHLEDAAARVLGGTEPRAFREIVAATSAELVRLAARIMGNLADAEDVVQEAYLRAHRSLVAGQFDGRSRLRTWLRRIVANAAIDALRSRKRRPAPTDTTPEVAWDGAASAEARVALAELDDWLGALPPDQRVALTLSALEGLGNGEIAELMGCTEGAIEQRLVRARAALRKTRS